MEGDCPLGQGQVRAFHDSANRHGEILQAGITLDQAGALRFVFKAMNMIGTTMRANGIAVRPALFFEIAAGFIFVVEYRVAGISRYHDTSLSMLNMV